MELKTLNDIKPELKFTGREVKEVGLRFTDMPKVEFIQKERDRAIRQEAIKHIKSKIKRIEAHSHKKFNWNYSYMECLQCRNYFVQMLWIKHFFNIIEEDL